MQQRPSLTSRIVGTAWTWKVWDRESRRPVDVGFTGTEKAAERAVDRAVAHYLDAEKRLRAQRIYEIDSPSGGAQ